MYGLKLGGLGGLGGMYGGLGGFIRNRQLQGGNATTANHPTLSNSDIERAFETFSQSLGNIQTEVHSAIFTQLKEQQQQQQQQQQQNQQSATAQNQQFGTNTNVRQLQPVWQNNSFNNNSFNTITEEDPMVSKYSSSLFRHSMRKMLQNENTRSFLQHARTNTHLVNKKFQQLYSRYGGGLKAGFNGIAFHSGDNNGEVDSDEEEQTEDILSTGSTLRRGGKYGLGKFLFMVAVF
jgi:hypothetical protein